jgi:hypothetical protein
MEATTYAPLVEYTQNKEFAGLMETLFGAVEKLSEQGKINEGDYLDLANLTKALYEAKTQIQQTVVFIDIMRRAKKEPPQPPKQCDKLNDKTYRTCEFCSKRLHCKYLPTHLRESRTCLLQQQARRNMKVEKYEEKDDRHTARQAFCLQLRPRYKTGVIETKQLATKEWVRPLDNQMVLVDNWDGVLIHTNRIMDCRMPPTEQRTRKEGTEVVEYTYQPPMETHYEANRRAWNDMRPLTAPTFAPHFTYLTKEEEDARMANLCEVSYAELMAEGREAQKKKVRQPWKFGEFRPTQLETVFGKMPFEVLVKVFNTFKDGMPTTHFTHTNGSKARLTKNARIELLKHYGKNHPEHNIQANGEPDIAGMITGIVRQQFYNHQRDFDMEIH